MEGESALAGSSTRQNIMGKIVGGSAAYAVALVLTSVLGGCGAEEGVTDGYVTAGRDSTSSAVGTADVAQSESHGAETQQVLQALQGLMAIRQDQCQSGNNLACQSLQAGPPVFERVRQLGQTCQRGDDSACSAFNELAQQIQTAYSESAAVMQAGADGMARMNAWRSNMNANAAANMAALQAQSAAGQAAHNARQQQYAQMNQAWEAGQAGIDRNHGRAVDRIYEGTTMDGGGVQSRIPYGSTGYTDGSGNVIAVPSGVGAPAGYRQMSPTHAAPQ